MPAFLKIALMPFTYSIANGISIGIVAFVVLNGARNAFSKDKSEKVHVHWLMWVIALLALARYIFLAGQ
jgi:AGZA family xanthine/uracil permease-like MFS transporter